MITARRLLTPAEAPGPARVVIDGGVVAAVEPWSGSADVEVLGPGFVDLQVNGAAGVAAGAGADWDGLVAALARTGVTSWCPTLTTRAFDAYPADLAAVSEAAAAHEGILGAHLEGPFLAVPGAHPVDHLQAEVDRAWLAALPPAVRLVTIAPELPGALGAVADLAGRGVTVSLGHSAADAATARAAVDAGARMATHVFNAMAPLHHRAPGLVGVALTDDRVTAGLVLDFVHVDPVVASLVLRAKGPGGVVLVTDVVAGPSRRSDGTLAGSDLTMDRAVRNAVAAGWPLADAVAAATAVPAALVGATDRGRVAPGCRADLVAMTADGHLAEVWVGGQPVGLAAHP